MKKKWPRPEFYMLCSYFLIKLILIRHYKMYSQFLYTSSLIVLILALAGPIFHQQNLTPTITLNQLRNWESKSPVFATGFRQSLSGLQKFLKSYGATTVLHFKTRLKLHFWVAKVDLNYFKSSLFLL